MLFRQETNTVFLVEMNERAHSKVYCDITDVWSKLYFNCQSIMGTPKLTARVICLFAWLTQMDEESTGEINMSPLRASCTYYETQSLTRSRQSKGIYFSSSSR